MFTTRVQKSGVYGTFFHRVLGTTSGLRCDAIVCQQFGEPSVMKISQTLLPPLKEGQVLVKMKAAGVNPSDTYMRLGPSGPWAATPHLLPPLPFTPGKDGAGVIENMGSGVDETRFKGTNRVYMLGSVSGTYSEYAVCNANDVFPLPDNISFLQGACVGE
jgi:NADPH2:quinone reductase